MPELILLFIMLCVMLGLWLFSSAIVAGLQQGFEASLVFQAVGSAVSVALFNWSALQIFT